METVPTLGVAEIFGIITGQGSWLSKLVMLMPVIFYVTQWITTMTPTKLDDKVFGKVASLYNPIMKLLNMLLGNVGRNANLDELAADKALRDDLKEKASQLSTSELRSRIRRRL